MFRLQQDTSLALVVCLSLLAAGCGGGRPSRERRPRETTEATTPATTTSTTPQAEAKPIDPSKLGSIEVTVKYTGDPKLSKEIKLDSDPFCATAHEKAVDQEKFVRNENMTMANAVVYLADGADAWEAPDPEGKVVLDQVGCIYVPHVATAQTKQDIEFKNSDETLHNVHPTPKKNKPFNKATPANSSVTESFRRDEMAIPVKCDVHPWMRSYLSVFKHPWHAVTPKGDGVAKIMKVPAGKYKIGVWHESLKETMSGEVEVKAGETKKVEIVFE